MAKPVGAIGKAKRAAAMQRRLERGAAKLAARAERRSGERRRWFSQAAPDASAPAMMDAES